MLQPNQIYGKVMTVRGLISPEEMGNTLSHEHVFIRLHFPDYVLDDLGTAIHEMELLRDAPGGIETENKTVVDLSCHGLRIDDHAQKLLFLSREISNSTDHQLHVILGTGFYKADWHPPDMDERSASDLTSLMIKEILEGIGDTGIRAGVIGEIGISGGTDITSIDKNEHKVVDAAASAHRVTGAAINLHFQTGMWTQPCINEALRVSVVKYLADDYKIAPNRIIVSHCSPHPDSHAHNKQLLDIGVYLLFDTFGDYTVQAERQNYVTAGQAIKTLIESNSQYNQQILLSQDVCHRMSLCQNGGLGYIHLLKDVLGPIWCSNDVCLNGGSQIRPMMVENPQKALQFRIS